MLSFILALVVAVAGTMTWVTWSRNVITTGLLRWDHLPNCKLTGCCIAEWSGVECWLCCQQVTHRDCSALHCTLCSAQKTLVLVFPSVCTEYAYNNDLQEIWESQQVGVRSDSKREERSLSLSLQISSFVLVGCGQHIISLISTPENEELHSSGDPPVVGGILLPHATV